MSLITESAADAHWGATLGRAWAAMLRAHGLAPHGTVVEVGPGFGDKVARGLAALDFRGTVILAEPNAAAAGWASERYRGLLPRAEVLVVPGRVPGCGLPRGLAVDALLSNHLLDDLIIDAALPPPVSDAIFSGMRPRASCSPAFVDNWRALLDSPERLGRLVARASAGFARYVSGLNPRLVLLNQYPSWRHERHGLAPIHTQALRLMRLLEADLGADGVDADAAPECRVRWLVGGWGRAAAARPGEYRDEH